MTTDIRETGIRGFLKWLQTEQPAIYAKAAPIIAQQLPAAFSDYHQGGWRVAGLTRDQAVDRLNGLASLGIDTLPQVNVVGNSPSPITYTGSVDMTGITIDPGAVPTVDTSTAANDGGASTGITDTIGSIVKGISSLWLTKQQVNIQQQVVNTQLQRAALGLPPLPQSLSQLGIPQVSVGLSTGTGSALGIGAAVVAAILIIPKLLGGRSSARR